MPRKTRPRWGDAGVTEVPDFALGPEQARDIAARLNINDQQKIDALAGELSEIGQNYLRWSAQDEQGPTRAERNAALKEVVETSRRLEFLLKSLDHASEAGLMDALAPYRSELDEFDVEGNVIFTHKTEEHGFRQIESLRQRLTHFNQYAHPYLKRQLRRRGPDQKKTLPAICGELAELYRRTTGKDLTHNPNNKTEYKGAPQSEAVQFIAAFLKLVDPKLPPSRISSTLVDIVKKRNQQD